MYLNSKTICHFRHLSTCISEVIAWDDKHSVSVQLLSHVWLFALWDSMNLSTLGLPVHHQLVESTQIMSIESVMPSNYLIFCCPLLLLPSIFLSTRVFSNELAFRIRRPKDWSFGFSISPSDEYPGLISFRMDWLEMAAKRNYHMSKVRSSGCALLEQPWRDTPCPR